MWDNNEKQYLFTGAGIVGIVTGALLFKGRNQINKQKILLKDVSDKLSNNKIHCFELHSDDYIKFIKIKELKTTINFPTYVGYGSNVHASMPIGGGMENKYEEISHRMKHKLPKHFDTNNFQWFFTKTSYTDKKYHTYPDLVSYTKFMGFDIDDLKITSHMFSTSYGQLKESTPIYVYGSNQGETYNIQYLSNDTTLIANALFPYDKYYIAGTLSGIVSLAIVGIAFL